MEKKIIRYITEKIDDVGVECRRNILNHISGWYGKSIIWENNQGIGIRFEDLRIITLNEIKKIIDINLSEHLIDFSELSDDDD